NYYGGEDNVQVPYWLMNWADFRSLLKPSDATQAPLLNSAIGLAKNDEETSSVAVLSLYLKADIESILNSTSEELKKRTGYQEYGRWKWLTNNEILNIAEAIREFDEELANLVSNLGSQANFNNAALQTPIRALIQDRLDVLL